MLTPPLRGGALLTLAVPEGGGGTRSLFVFFVFLFFYSLLERGDEGGEEYLLATTGRFRTRTNWAKAQSWTTKRWMVGGFDCGLATCVYEGLELMGRGWAISEDEPRFWRKGCSTTIHYISCLGICRFDRKRHNVSLFYSIGLQVVYNI